MVGSMPPFITRLDYFGSRRDLWDDPKSYSKYIPAPDFKKTGMSRHRFEDIWSSLRWSKQLENAGGCVDSRALVSAASAHIRRILLRNSIFLPSVQRKGVQWVVDAP